MRLIHLTDPHLSNLDDQSISSLRGKRWSGYISWRKNRRKRYLPAVLNKLVDEIRKEDADQIFLTGDLIQIGLDSEIAQATDWLRSLGTPEQVMLVPGNHDIYARGSAEAANRAWSEYLFHPGLAQDWAGSREFPVLRKSENFSFVGLSTACVTPLFMASGELGEEQLSKLAELLDQLVAENQFVCLLIHHPPLPGMTKWRKALKDATALQAVLQGRPPMLVFHGHLHHNRELLWNESRIYCTSSASSVSDASYRIIDIEDHGDCWDFRMVLKTIAIQPTGELSFLTIDEQLWQLPKSPA